MPRIQVLACVTLPVIFTVLFYSYPGEAVPLSQWGPSEYMIKVYKQLGQKSPFTPNKTDNEEELSRTIVELLAWTPPDYIVKNFPCYFAGYSYDGKPVWIVEGGACDINDLIRQGPEMIKAAEIAVEQALLRIFRSMDERRGSDGDIPRAQVILDLDGLSAKQVSHPKAFALGFKLAYRYLNVGFYGLESGIVINSNYFVETLVSLARPVLGQLMERVEIYGSNKSKWIPRLRRLLPPSFLPPWYGGDPEFKPLEAYG